MHNIKSIYSRAKVGIFLLSKIYPKDTDYSVLRGCDWWYQPKKSSQYSTLKYLHTFHCEIYTKPNGLREYEKLLYTNKTEIVNHNHGI